MKNGNANSPSTRFGSTVHFCFRNEDGSIHVAELEMDGAVFHYHETMRWFDAIEPVSAKGVTTVIGLFVDDVHKGFNRGISACKHCCMAPYKDDIIPKAIAAHLVQPGKDL